MKAPQSNGDLHSGCRRGCRRLTACGVAFGTALLLAACTESPPAGPNRMQSAVTAPAAVGTPDPTLLPVANKQPPDVAAYTALNVPGLLAGSSYSDPVTRVRVWKVTSSTVPVGNSGAGHDYGEGANEVSRGWGPNNDTHTILIRGDGMEYYLVDFTRGGGFDHYRALPPAAQPIRDLAFTFSSVAGQERIAYVINGGQLKRFNTDWEVMQVQNTPPNFPLDTAMFGWLHQDKNDEWFVGLVSNPEDAIHPDTAFAWNSQTGSFYTHPESWLNEPRLERNGRYVGLAQGIANGNVLVWDLLNNTFGPVQQAQNFAHLASLRGRWVTTNTDASAPPPLDRYQVINGSLTSTPGIFNNSGGYSTNNSGNWVQADDNTQWAYISGTDDGAPWQSSLIFNRGIGLVRADGSDARLLCHHYTSNPDYWDTAWGKPSPDGRVVIFNSNMNLGRSARYDLFIAEVPLR